MHWPHINLAALFQALTPVRACGMAIVCVVFAVAGTQLALRAWREADDRTPQADDRPFVAVHARASAERARSRAEAFQFGSTVLLVTAACIAIYAIAPGLLTVGLVALALIGTVYLLVDAYVSYLAETRAITAQERDDATTQATSP